MTVDVPLTDTGAAPNVATAGPPNVAAALAPNGIGTGDPQPETDVAPAAPPRAAAPDASSPGHSRSHPRSSSSGSCASTFTGIVIPGATRPTWSRGRTTC